MHSARGEDDSAVHDMATGKGVSSAITHALTHALTHSLSHTHTQAFSQGAVGLTLLLTHPLTLWSKSEGEKKKRGTERRGEEREREIDRGRGVGVF